MDDGDDARQLMQFLRAIAAAPERVPTVEESLRQMSLAVGDTVASYAIEAPLRAGGMGVVVRARDADGSPVALKLLRPELAHDPTFAARLEREALAIRRLDHPHIVRLIDHGTHGATFFLAMELLEGETLSQAAAREAPIDLGRARAWLAPIADALTYAHDEGVLHRDVKPANVFLRDGREPVLLDFGVAKLGLEELERLTRSGIRVGTPAYMSPEQLRDSHRVGTASDQYSFAVVLYELLSGALPHASKSAYMLLVEKLGKPPPDLGALRPDLPRAACAAVMRALAADPAARFAGVRELVSALGE